MRLRVALGALAAVAVGIQLIPVGRENPPSDGEITVPDSVGAILTRACYDCHSHETRWPFYAYVAPVSWLVAKDVTSGRTHLNFSTWNQYDVERQERKLEEIWEEVEEGNMPLKVYLPLHPGAKLSEQDRAILRAWILREREVLQSPNDSAISDAS